MSDFLSYVGGPFGAAAVAAVTAVSGFYFVLRPRPQPLPVDLNQQAIECPDEPGAYMSPFCKDGKVLESNKTLYDALKHGARESNNGPCLGWREGPDAGYSWLSYNDVMTKASRVGAGLIKLGLDPSNKTFVGIYSQNRPEYMVSELGCYLYSMVVVPLYDTLGPDACSFIISQAEISLVICDKNEKVALLLAHKDRTASLRTIIVMETVSQENMKAAEALGLTLVQFKDLEVLGETNPATPKECKPDDLCCICYTSGTTGDPKGVILTHKSVMSSVESCLRHLEFMNFGPEETAISYLPLAHMYERLNTFFMFMLGGRVGYFRGDVKLLLEDIAVLKPTVFPSVPRLLNRLYDKVMSTVSSSRVKKCLFNMAVSSKMAEMKRGVFRNNSIWDKIVFAKVQQTLGGRVKFIATGSAPLSAKVMDFVRCATGAMVFEGFGQTESSAIATLQVPGESEGGHVGTPLPACMVKVEDVPEMGYFAANNEGEILIKGSNVFQGYYKNPEKTAEALDSNGWLHTGDIGMIQKNGTVKIIDRKKHIFKLAQGEYIAPEKIENIYIRSPLVAQMFVHGDSFKACLVGIAVPDPDVLPGWAQKNLGLTGSMADLCANKAVKQAIFDSIQAVGLKNGLKSFEQVKDIYVYPELFSVENGLLTPTFKSKRHDLKKFFANEIVQMYMHLE